MRDPELMSRLQEHRFGAEAHTQSFASRLAAQELWDPDYAARVVQEYKRFLYLSQVSEKPVTPSVAVDAAWHLHLAMTRDYWQVLCKQVLRNDLHHDAADTGEDSARMADQYAATRRLYAQEFGAVAPTDIWPIPGQTRGAARATRPLFIVGAATGIAGAGALFAGASVLGITGLVLGAGLIIWGLLQVKPAKADRTGGTFVAGCSGGHGKGNSSAVDGGAGDGGAGCGGGGCGGGGG
ncbi:glycine-rich domain-containing protein [Actibacterium ureilyticum]|uniref:glycine-rich domain-containing protein n=1 Tax=Actibacterium ureilyticum TaxID=1590614 RepID=UPI000BAAD46A|nr:hypothetical protein [Actibacterium ureilyticum]